MNYMAIRNILTKDHKIPDKDIAYPSGEGMKLTGRIISSRNRVFKPDGSDPANGDPAKSEKKKKKQKKKKKKKKNKKKKRNRRLLYAW